ncbi:MAG: TMEM143 family protein [Planctomycetota bacterium]
MADAGKRESFIPVRKSDLIALLCGDPALADDERQELEQLCRLIVSTFHFEFHARLQQLTDAYALFDPDADTRPLRQPSEAEQRQQIDSLFEQFGALLERGNYLRLSHDDIVQALNEASEWGLRLDVDFSVFERLEMFVRGDEVTRRTRRRWRNRLRLEQVEVPVYQRLVVIFRLRPQRTPGPHADAKAMHVKVFKGILKKDLEMLLPGTRVRLSLADRGRIILPALSGVLLTAWKIVQGALTIAAAGAYGALAFLGLVGGTIGYGVRSFFGYVHTKQKYQLSLTQSLYYQNLDNNAGALFRVLDDAEEQECREALLAYYVLWREAGERGCSRAELDRLVEDLLERKLGVRVDFEIGDAIDKLKRLQLVDELPDDGWRAVPMAECLKRLDRAWDGFFQYAGSCGG